MSRGSNGRGDRKDNRSGKLPSQRQLRVGELVRHELSTLFSRGDLHDPSLAGRIITVPEVRMSPDLKTATAFIMPLGGASEQDVVSALNRQKKRLRGLLTGKLDLKFMPDLKFQLDHSFDESGKIDALLRSPNVARDLGDGPDESE